jgi:hypothetical protein
MASATHYNGPASASYEELHPGWSHFSPEERQHLLAEDNSALRTVAGILLAIVSAGFLAGAVAVWLMS